jgi:L-lactate dehydrogenase
VGEHGDSEVLTWSLAAVGNVPIAEFARLQGVALDDAIRTVIDGKVRRAAYTIISGKGATYYGIGSALARIVEAVLHDQRAILTVCGVAAHVGGVTDVTVSLPRLVGGNGILADFPLPLAADEHQQLAASAAIIKNAINELGDD